MNLKYLVLFNYLMVLSFMGFSQNRSDSTDNGRVYPIQMGIYENTSLIKLIATPEKYDGKTIQVIGFLRLEFEGNAIYLHKEDYENSLTENSFWVSFSQTLTKEKNILDFNDKYVIMIGTFKMNDKGHMGLFGGTLENIVRLDTWSEMRTKR